MASTFETGHAKNVANFDELISFITGYGAVYNPSKASLKLTALKTLSTNAKNAVNTVNGAMPSYKNAVANRQSAFTPLSKLITRVMNAAIVTMSKEEEIEHVRSLVRKIQGRRAEAKKSEEELQALALVGKETKNISASQMSYDNRLDSLDKLIKLLSSNTLYKPNETELKLTSLTNLFKQLFDANALVLQATVPLSNARLVRNDVLYLGEDCLVTVALESKTYIKSLFGVGSPQYKQISKLSFKKVRI